MPVVTVAAPAAAATSQACSTSGPWRSGEVNAFWFEVEQGDAQLVVGPTGSATTTEQSGVRRGFARTARDGLEWGPFDIL